jgi:hypothetical protein
MVMLRLPIDHRASAHKPEIAEAAA